MLAMVLQLFPAWGLPGSHKNAQWYPPARNQINNLTTALYGEGVYDFIYNSSVTPDGAYGTYNWCNMPHVRNFEYVKAGEDYELQYVELVSRLFFTFSSYSI